MPNILIWVQSVGAADHASSGVLDRIAMSGKVWADTDSTANGAGYNWLAYSTLPYTTPSEDIDDACITAALAVASGQGFTPGSGDTVRLMGQAMSRRVIP